MISVNSYGYPLNSPVSFNINTGKLIIDCIECQYDGWVEFRLGNETYKVKEKNGSCCPESNEIIDALHIGPSTGPSLPWTHNIMREYGSSNCEPCPCIENCIDLYLEATDFLTSNSNNYKIKYFCCETGSEIIVDPIPFFSSSQYGVNIIHLKCVECNDGQVQITIIGPPTIPPDPTPPTTPPTIPPDLGPIIPGPITPFMEAVRAFTSNVANAETNTLSNIEFTFTIKFNDCCPKEGGESALSINGSNTPFILDAIQFPASSDFHYFVLNLSLNLNLNLNLNHY
jgi:hypothetical protein